MSDKLISADALREEMNEYILPLTENNLMGAADVFHRTVHLLEEAPAVDAVAKDKYDELREAFVDFVCSGVHNPAPYCKNRCKECVDSYGYCLFCNINCRGFNPDGERREENAVD